MGKERWLWGPLAVIALAQLMVVMDATLVTVALPSAQRALGMSDTTRQWVITAFLLTRAGLVLAGGRLADRFGHRRLLLVAVAGFGAASALAGAAPAAWVLLLARALQGAFGALLVASTRALLVTIYAGERERARALGIFAAVLTAGLAFGFVASGFLTAFLGWRWSLYVNVPLAAAALAGAFRVLPNPVGHPAARVDAASALLAFATMAALVYGLSGTGDTVAWLGGAAAALAAFLVRQARSRNPLLPLRLLADRWRGGALVAMGVNTFGTLGMMLVLTYRLQAVMRYTPLAAGLALIPFAAGSAVGSAVFAPRLMVRADTARLAPAGLALAAGGLLLLSRPGAGGPALALIVVAEVITGVGSGVVSTPALHAALRGVAPADTGVTAALTSVAPQLGGSVGTALLNTIAVAATAGAARASTAHGLAVACAWGGGIELGAAVMVGALMGVRRPRTSA